MLIPPADAHADILLLDRIAKRDAHAIGEMYDRHHRLLFALILTETTNANTLPIGIAGRVTQYKTEWGEIAAAGFAGCLPIIIFAFIVQKHLVRGLSFGAVKG